MRLHRDVDPESTCGGQVASGRDLFNTDYWCVYCGAKWSDPTPMSIHVEGRRWFQLTYGNTYHTAEVFISNTGKRTDEVSIGIVPFSYGYGDQYLQSAHELLIKKGILPDEESPHGGREPLWRVCQRIGYDFTYQVTDGLKRELHNQGRE